MISNAKMKMRDREFALIAGLLAISAVLMYVFPSFAVENSAGQIDWITLPLVAFPLIAGTVLMAFASMQPYRLKDRIGQPIKLISLAFSLMMLGISSGLLFGWLESINWDLSQYNRYELEFEYAWMQSIGVSWHVGLDGLSFSMVWLTTVLIPIVMITTWEEKIGWYHHPLILMMGGALIGVFVALDFFMFFVFWEMTLIPMFFLILKWGGEDRRYAAQKFFIYTFTGSVVMLLGIITLYFLQPFSQALVDQGVLTGRTFDMTQMAIGAQAAANADIAWLGINMQKALFLTFLLGFLVKLPAVPFHTWLPDAHVQAPTAGSMLLAGVMLKMGGYGLFRVCATLFPEALLEYQWLLLTIGMVSLVYGSFVCLGQSNLKRLVAFSSVSHMGIILLGIATMEPLGFAGAIFMMFAHGIISPLLFAVAGAFKHHYHTLEIGSMRGMAKHSPWLATFMMFGWMASLGLPLLAGFVAEITVLIAFWKAFGWWVILPGITLIVTAAYYIWSMQKTIFEGGDDGEMPESLGGEPAPDISMWEVSGMMLLAMLTVLFGVLPWIFFDMMTGYAFGLFDGILLNVITGGA
ncbi:MAG: dehydrogenase [Methanobacteriota archaeon]|nr:MAG: dehydrogenase [Euryarchaeota archaeon]PXY77011.1 MAG: dehydrogenase [Euryarchaeota archaeon]HIA39419.1 NADH-quinone oxidoreductase subunit M [Candidatus Poseidoniales archaeon]HIA90206.1 NADH-quinone oxidoreductase subunit M [Candidatus Poseidoniales archaeon]